MRDDAARLLKLGQGASPSQSREEIAGSGVYRFTPH
jgi:hypothetical protein